MDSRSRKRAGRIGRDEWDELMRRAVAQVRAAPVPVNALARALEESRRIAAAPPWRRWLLQGEAGRN